MCKHLNFLNLKPIIFCKSNSCSTSCTCPDALATKLMISDEGRKDRLALDFIFFWLLVYYIVHRKSKNEIIACQCFNIGYHRKTL